MDKVISHDMRLTCEPWNDGADMHTNDTSFQGIQYFRISINHMERLGMHSLQMKAEFKLNLNLEIPTSKKDVLEF